MKAAVLYGNGGPDVLIYEDVPDPVPAAHEVLIDVRGIGVQGGDLLARARSPLPTTPHIVGYQAAGVIIGVGDDVENLQVGQPVVAFAWSGSHAEQLCASAATVWPIPADLPFDVAASIPIEFGTADDCLFEFGHLVAGETVLVQAAASGVGLATVQLAKAAGAMVIGTASSDERLARLGAYGLDVAINYVNSDAPKAVREATNGKGADLVVDSVGGRMLEQSLRAVAYRGRVSWIGQAGRDFESPSLERLLGKNATMTGVFLGAEMTRNIERVHPLISRLITRIAAGELAVVIDSTFPLADASAAHRYIEGRNAFGRVVLVP